MVKMNSSGCSRGVTYIWLRLYYYFSSLLIFFLGICYAATTVWAMPVFKGGLRQSAIFPDSQKALQHCMVPSNHNVPDCLLQYYKDHGASWQAIKFLQLTNGYIQKITTYGNISIILAHVMAADHSQQIYIVNAQGDLFDLNYPSKKFAADLDNQFKKNKKYQALVKTDPLIFYFNNDLAPRVQRDKKGNVSVFFSYRITNCMACAKTASAAVAFKFGARGSLRDVLLLSIKKT